MATYASVTGRRQRSGQPAVTPERIVATALDLTRAHGLEDWTLRQLAAGVGAYPAVIYHHVGDREAVVAAVLDRVVGALPVPEADLPWRTWFERFLTDARPVLLAHPGVARRLAVHGELVPALHPVIDRAVTVLRHAGFGDRAVPAHTFLTAQAWQFLAAEDDRDAALRARTAALRTELADRAELSGLVELGRYHRAHPDTDLYAYAVATALDGVAAQAAPPRALGGVHDLSTPEVPSGR
ncbi:TetR/AcrR family transcriptional regulator [Actinokineospora auranticolor]|uniref:Regulatory TetR family protein n=1 Tax=Actinokineospora auranticolor TaxID=155976 RepID=A0A2S6GFY0_9PSEU|nr:TetR/AcrR family transcriptional regulator [Actinokineospora auranticolor]PPK64056.1 regulatory TetR family protein [Actinokineospora auranticolor]